jgi:hypothetical protein
MRKSKWSEHRVYLGTSVPNSIFGEIERLAKECNLGKAQIARALCIRGLAAYYRDGQLSQEHDTKLVETTNLCVLDDVVSTDAEALTVSTMTTVGQAAQL